MLLIAGCLLVGQSLAQKTIRDEKAQKRNTGSFSSINVSGGVDLYLTQSNENAVAVSAEREDDRDKIITEVENGVLKIYYKKENSNWPWGVSWGNKKLKAYVSVKTLERLQASGGSDVVCEGVINASALKIHMSGGSDLRGEFTCQELTVNASGGSDASLKGNATRLTIDASGGSDINAYRLSSDICRIHSSGGSDVNVTVSKSIDAHASGGSDIYYKGSPGETKISKSGGSDIRKRQ